MVLSTSMMLKTRRINDFGWDLKPQVKENKKICRVERETAAGTRNKRERAAGNEENKEGKIKKREINNERRIKENKVYGIDYP